MQKLSGKTRQKKTVCEEDFHVDENRPKIKRPEHIDSHFSQHTLRPADLFNLISFHFCQLRIFKLDIVQKT